MKKLKFLIILLILLIISNIIIISVCNSKSEIRIVSSKNALERLYNNSSCDVPNFLVGILTTPWSFGLSDLFNSGFYDRAYIDSNDSISSRNWCFS